MTNYNFPRQDTVERIRNMYPKGARVELVEMTDPYNRLVPGDRGTVKSVDDTGTIHVSWDGGGSLGILYGIDRVRKL